MSWLSISAYRQQWHFCSCYSFLVHRIHSLLRPSQSLALPLLYALTWCEVTSQFLSSGMQKAWTAWNSTPILIATTIALTENPEYFTLESSHMECIEIFVVRTYSKACGCATVTDARLHLFSNGSLDSIPPTQIALFQHVKRSLLQASFDSRQSTTCHWMPFWTIFTDTSKACPLLVHCGCTTACKGEL